MLMEGLCMRLDAQTRKLPGNQQRRDVSRTANVTSGQEGVIGVSMTRLRGEVPFSAAVGRAAVGWTKHYLLNGTRCLQKSLR